MSLDKAVKYGKEKRKPYRGSKLIDYTCRNHGGCPYCEQNRKHKFRDKHPVEKDEMIIWIADGRKDPSFLLLKNIYSTKKGKLSSSCLSTYSGIKYLQPQHIAANFREYTLFKDGLRSSNSDGSGQRQQSLRQLLFRMIQ